MDLSTISTLMTGTLSDFGDQVLIVLTAVIGVAIAYFLFRFAFRKIKGSVSDGQPHHWKWDRVDHHMSNAEMRHRGIKPNAIRMFDEGRF